MPAKNTLHQSFKEIAKRFSIPEDQIQTILDRIKIKSSDKPSGEQLQGFEKVCDMLRSGMQLDVAVETIHEEAKNNQTDQKQAQPSASANGQSKSASLAVADTGAISSSDGQEFAQDFNWQGLEQSVKEVAQQVAPEARQKFVRGAADEADHVANGMYAYGRYAMHEVLRDEIGKGDSKQIKDEILRSIRTGKSQTGSPRNSP